MSTTSGKWIALAATEALPIALAPVEAEARGIAPVRTVGLPYKPLTEAEENARTL